MQKGARTKPRAAKSWKASDAEAPVAPRQGGDLLKLQADAYLAAIIESSDDAIISKTLDGTISSWNKGAERIFGYQAEEAIGKPIYLLIPPELAHEEVGILARLRRGKRIDHYETVRVRKDGTRLNVSLTVSPVKDRSGQIIGASKIARDITERKQLQQRLEREQERLRVTFASIGDGVIVTDLLGRVQFLNPVAEELTGWKQKDAKGQPLEEVFKIVNEKTCLTAPNPALKALKEGQIVGLANHTALIARDGSEHPIDDSAAPIREEDGTVAGVVLVFRDVGATRAAEETRARLAAIVESSDDAIISKTLDGTISSWNKGAERIFGYRAEEAIGKPIYILVPPELAQEEARILTRLKRGQRIDHYETVRARKDGTRLNVSLTVSPIKDKSGQIIGASKIARDITEWKQFQQRLEQEEERLRVTFASIGDAVIVTDLSGRVQFLNPVAEELMGWKQKEAEGRPLEEVFDIVNEKTRLPAPNPALKALKEGRIVGLANHTVLIARDGSEHPIDDSAAPIREEDGTVAGVVLVFRDVGDRRAAEESRARLAAIVESSDDAIIGKDLDGRITSWNEGAERLFGYSRDEALGQNISLLIPRDRLDEETQILERLKRGQRVHHFETIRLSKDQRKICVSLTVSPVRDAEGTVIGASKIARDITERKQTEDALRRSEALKTGILNSGLDAIITINHEAKIIEFNPAAERIFGYRREAVVGKAIAELIIPPSLRETHARGMARYLATGETNILGRRLEIEAMRADGSEFPCELTVLRVPLDGPPLFTAFLRDITERKRTVQELAKAKEDLEEYARNLETTVAKRTADLRATIAELESVSYSLSHDMRAPLRTIQSFSQIVLAEAGQKIGPMEADLLKKSISAAERLDRLIQDVLIYSRLSQGNIELKPVEVEPLLRQIIGERPELQPPKADIEIRGPLHAVSGHEAYLTQCISNLLDNGVKFVAEGVHPKIRIWNELRENQVRFWFEDNGIGIPKEAQERMFGMFQRLHSDKIYPGTGIGLAIVRKAAERMGGTVGVESEPGKGSRFWLQLPRAI